MYTKYDDTQLENLISEANKESKKRHDKDVRQFKADIRKKAKPMGLNVVFEDAEPKSQRQKL
ncbi:MAG: hypothetical protein AAFZ92_05305 [Pseudomonadota bacterium]